MKLRDYLRSARHRSGVNYDAATVALLSRMSVQPSGMRANAINSLILSLKSAGLWTLLDAFYVWSAHTEQAAQLNWIQDAYNITPRSSPTFGPNVGYHGDAKASWWDSNFNPTTAASPKYTQNSASMGVWFIDASTTDGQQMAGLLNGSNQGTQIIGRNKDSKSQFRINQASAIVGSATISNGTGLVSVNRSDSTNVQMYVRGASYVTSSATASIALVNGTIGFGRTGSTSSLYGANTLGAGFIGASLTSAQHAAIHAALNTYMASITDYTVVTSAATDQSYLGGYIEIQPDSFNGGQTIPATDGTTDIWGFPYSLTGSEQTRLRSLVMPGGGKGIQFLRLPLGFAYRGYRNIDGTSGLAKNIGERFSGQNSALSSLIANVTASGGGLAPEYWCPPPHWMINSSYSGSSGSLNQLWAGGSYARSVTLDSIRGTDATQYAAQIAAFTDAIVNDLEYVHQNVGPVRIYGLQNEPSVGNAPYGSNRYTSDQLYGDVLNVLVPKVNASSVLATWGGVANTPKLHVYSDDIGLNYGSAWQAANAASIWSYTYHNIADLYTDADWIKTAIPSGRGTRSSLWANEVEYFTVPSDPNWQCANNMLRNLNGLVYGSAPCVMPIIHMVKQLGQQSATSNTDGYGLMKMRLPAPYGQDPSTPGDPDPTIGYGQFAPVTANYNSYLLVADNVPVGAVRFGGAPSLPYGVGFAAFTSGGKTILLMANRNASSVTLNIPLTASKTMNGKAYSMTQAGASAGTQTGSTLQVTLAAYSGQAWVEA